MVIARIKGSMGRLGGWIMAKLGKWFILLMFYVVAVAILYAIFLPDSWAVKYLAIFQSILALALVTVTFEYAKSTQDLVDESIRNREAESAREEERRRLEEEKEKRNQFLNILLAEFIENQEIIKKLKKAQEDSRAKGWTYFELMSLNFKDGGFSAFKNR